MENYIRENADAYNLAQTKAALNYAKEKHDGQCRKEGWPFIIHPLTLVYMAMRQGIREDALLSVMLLHDICEDCGIEPERLPFSTKVQLGVKSVTFQVMPNETFAQAKDRYFQEMRLNREGCITKIFDRCHNISTMAEVFSEKKMLSYIEETKQYVMPLIEDAIQSYPRYETILSAVQFHMKSVIASIESLIYLFSK